jgi:hypothetical protein
LQATTPASSPLARPSSLSLAPGSWLLAAARHPSKSVAGPPSSPKVTCSATVARRRLLFFCPLLLLKMRILHCTVVVMMMMPVAPIAPLLHGAPNARSSPVPVAVPVQGRDPRPLMSRRRYSPKSHAPYCAVVLVPSRSTDLGIPETVEQPCEGER